GVRPDADAGLAAVGLGAGVTVRAGAAVRLGRGGADAVGRVADAGDVALVERAADDGVRARTGAGLASVGLGAGITVGAGAAVGLARSGAGAVGGIASAGVVTLIEGRADDRARARADARLAGVALRASATVVAGRAVNLVRVGACARPRIAGASVVALIEGATDDRVRARADARLTGVALRAGATVVAGRAVNLVR